MNLIQRLMGRRQFLMAAGMASTCALTCKKLAGFETRAAMAADRAASAAVKAAGNRCPNLLSPLKVGNRVLKNRIIHSISPVYVFQGPENFPAEAWRNHYSILAKNAAVITMETMFGSYPKKYHTKEESFAYWSWEHVSNNKWENIPPVYNYLERAMEDIHSEGCLIVPGTNTGDREDFIAYGDVSSESGSDGLGGEQARGGGTPFVRAEKSIEELVKDAKDKEDFGYDLYSVNTREAAEAVRNATSMIIMSPLNLRVSNMGTGGGIPGKPTAEQIEQAVESARKLEGLVDILAMKGGGSSGASWEASKFDTGASMYYAEAIKKAGIKIITMVGGGLYDPIKNDEFIAKGMTDLIGMCRPLFADGEMVKKISSGRADEVIPCVQCQNCHSESMLKGPHFARCTVNPKWAMPIYKRTGIEAPLTKKKVAVVGGGPAGMKAAITAAERGHKVILYEKDAALGGLQKYTDYTPWVWTYKVFKDYLINQVKKAGVEVKLNTTATRDMLKAAGYDTVLVATGSDVVASKMKGADAGNVFDIVTCHSKRKSLGKNIVFIGSNKFGTEAALSLALDGYKVTVLSPGPDMIDPEDIGAHNVTSQTKLYRSNPNFKFFLKTTVKDITGGKVTYTDDKGAQQSLQADSIVIWSGLKARTEDADNFAGSADEVIPIGDCTGEKGRINRATRSAFYAASRV